MPAKRVIHGLLIAPPRRHFWGMSPRVYSDLVNRSLLKGRNWGSPRCAGDLRKRREKNNRKAMSRQPNFDVLEKRARFSQPGRWLADHLAINLAAWGGYSRRLYAREGVRFEPEWEPSWFFVLLCSLSRIFEKACCVKCEVWKKTHV
jgi:hypothetical protein